MEKEDEVLCAAFGFFLSVWIQASSIRSLASVLLTCSPTLPPYWPSRPNTACYYKIRRDTRIRTPLPASWSLLLVPHADQTSGNHRDTSSPIIQTMRKFRSRRLTKRLYRG